VQHDCVRELWLFGSRAKGTSEPESDIDIALALMPPDGKTNWALAAYVECMKVSTNDDALTATSDWMWMTLMRLGRKAEAAKLLERISNKMEILENGSYHRRLLMYKGVEKPETLLDPAKADGLTIATQGYGVGNWYFVTGNRARAREIFEQVVTGPNWSAFGYIAAEADLGRMK
jgi:hypothetical protein